MNKIMSAPRPISILLLIILVSSPAAYSLADQVRYDIFENVDPAPHPITIQSSLRSSPATSQGRTYGANFMVTYADMFAQDTGSCEDWCGKKFLLSLRSRRYERDTRGMLVGDVILAALAREQSQTLSTSQFSYHAVSTIAGFDEAIKKEAIDNPKSSKLYDLIYYFRKDKKGHIVSVLMCSPAATRPSCILHFSASCEPSLAAELSVIDYSEIKNVMDIEAAANSLIDQMVQSESCQQKV